MHAKTDSEPLVEVKPLPRSDLHAKETKSSERLEE